MRLLIVLGVVLSVITPSFAEEPTDRLSTLHRQLMRAVSTQSIVPVPNTHECDFKSSSCNTSFTAIVNIFGCRTDSFLYYNVYRLSVAASTRVTVTARSFSDSSFIAVFTDPSIDVVGSDLKSAGSTASVTFNNTASVPRSYLITIGPGDELEDGTFNATITCTPISTGGCTPSLTTLCLNGSRFAVTTTWRTSTGSGSATAVSMTSDTGHFWFFSSTNVELVVKILDGRGINNRWWVFYGALSDVEYTITVRDTQTGLVKTYFNPQGRMASVADTNAF